MMYKFKIPFNKVSLIEFDTRISSVVFGLGDSNCIVFENNVKLYEEMLDYFNVNLRDSNQYLYVYNDKYPNKDKSKYYIKDTIVDRYFEKYPNTFYFKSNNPPIKESNRILSFTDVMGVNLVKITR